MTCLSKLVLETWVLIEGDKCGQVQAHCPKKVTTAGKNPKQSIISLITCRHSTEKANLFWSIPTYSVLIKRKGAFSCDDWKNWKFPFLGVEKINCTEMEV